MSYAALEPDHAFDGLITNARGERVRCDVQIWLPRGPGDRARMAVFMAAGAHSFDLRGGVSVKAAEHVEKLGLQFEAQAVRVRDGKSKPAYRAGGTQLTIGHVGQWTLNHRRARIAEADQKQPPELESVLLTLSPMKYGAPETKSKLSYLGHRDHEYTGPYKSLRFNCGAAGTATFTWELQRHWTWTQAEDDAVSGFATPVLALTGSSQPLKATSLSEVKASADDTSVLLTLAARHRVVAQVIAYSTPEWRTQEWRYPLEPRSAVTEEEASGPLIAESELEQFFERAAAWWSPLHDDKKDAVRLAVFALHRVTETTLEADFMAKFAALEGLGKRWGAGENARPQVSTMVKALGLTPDGLWPLFDETTGKPLYWLRNEIAHGRTAPRLGQALVLACDHLHLWIERILLGLIGYARQASSDWLTSQVPGQQAELTRLRQELRSSPTQP